MTNRAGWGQRYVAWLQRRHVAVLAATMVLTILGAVGATRLHLRTSIKALLPSGDPSAAALDEAEKRMGELSTLVVVIRSPDRDHNLAYAERLSHKIEALGPDLVERAVYRLPDLKSFVENHRWLYADERFLKDVLDRIQFEKNRRKSPLMVALDEPPTVDELRARMKSGGAAGTRAPIADKLPGGTFETEEGHLVALVVMPGRTYESGSGDVKLEGAVLQAIRELPPSSVSADLDVKLSGEVHTSVLERRAIEEDMALTTAIVIVLVGLVVALYFGRLRAIPLMAAPAIVGAILALGFADAAFGALNATTAFLGAIIVGNGINYPVLLLARYDEERNKGRSPSEALSRAVCGTARPTAVAAFAASVAYGSLALTRFRGFSQFGVIGAVGMALCWLATMTLLPALLWRLDRNAPPVVARARRLNFGRLFAPIAERAPMAALFVGGVLTVGAVLVLPRWLADPYDYDFRHLRSLTTNDDVSSHLDGLFGRALNPSLLLAPTPEAAELARRTINTQAAQITPNPVAHLVTVADLLPGDAVTQQRKIALLDQIREELSPDVLAHLSDKERKDLSPLRPPANLQAVGASDLPPLALRPFTEKDGSVGRVVLVYPPQKGYSGWNGHDLFRLSAAIRDVPIGSQSLHGAGRPVVFSSMIAAIAHDGPLATAASLIGVAMLTIAILRRRFTAALWVLGALCVGVLWMLGVAAIADVKLNFLNFIALPITFGIGVDYAANVILREEDEGRGRIADVVRSTGGAVVLNSATTIIGYASLLVAHNRALRSFGMLAILGELACVSVAVIVLPSLLTLIERRRDRKEAVHAQPVPAR